MATGGAGHHNSTTSPHQARDIPSHRGAPGPAPQPAAAAVSPPSRRELASWWKKFRKQEKTDEKVEASPGIFGVPLADSIRYANVAISLTNEHGESFIYGYVPIVVAKCGVFLKEKATDVEGIFRLSGSAKRIKDLQAIFNSPDKFGKGLDWTGYTVHDAANILRRYLNQLPEPIVPLDFYERFRKPLRAFQARPQENGDVQHHDLNLEQSGEAVAAYQQLIRQLPPLNRQLLLYILDLLAVFASKSDLNRMTAANLAAIFQPGIISHPNHDMAPTEYRLSQDVLIFLIDYQDHFLIGMANTGMNEDQKAEALSGAPSVTSPKSNIGRSASNASAGADSLRKYGVRRNVSTSSHNSRERSSPGVSSPGTPTGHGHSQYQQPSGSIGRSNTLPSKKSPAVHGSRFQRMHESSPAQSPVISSPGPPIEESEASIVAAETLQNQSQHPTSTHQPAPAHQAVSQQPAQPQDAIPAPINTQQPKGQRKFSDFLSKSPIFQPTDPSRPQRKLQKKSRMPGNLNESAENSQTSLQDDVPFHTPLVSPEMSMNAGRNPMDNPALMNTVATPTNETKTPTSAEKQNHLQPVRSPAGSMHSRPSITDHSDFDQLDTPSAAAGDKKKQSRWRISSSARKTDDYPLVPPPPIGSNAGARGSNSSIGSEGRAMPRKSYTGTSQASTQHESTTTAGQSTLAGVSSQDSDERALKDMTNKDRDHGEEKKGLFGRWREKRQEKKEEKERAKSPPPTSAGPYGQGRIATDASNEGRSKGSLSAFANEHFSPGAIRRSFDSSSRPRGSESSATGQGMGAVPTSQPQQDRQPVQEREQQLETVKERPLSEGTLAAKGKQSLEMTPVQVVEQTPTQNAEQGGKQSLEVSPKQTLPQTPVAQKHSLETSQQPTGLGISQDEQDVSPTTMAPMEQIVSGELVKKVEEKPLTAA